MIVYYKGQIYQVINPPVRETLMPDLRTSCPNKKIDIENKRIRGSRKTVSISELMFQYEH